MNKVATEAEVRELARLHNVSLHGVTSNHQDYYRFSSSNHKRIDITMSGDLVSSHGEQEIKQWIQTELHDYNQ